MSDEPAQFVYEPDEIPKKKHHWTGSSAGFVKVGQNEVGKCPNGMAIDDAQKLLDAAIPFFPDRWRRSYPQRLYAVADGVLYRATPTNPGTSYHGFPEHPSSFCRGGNAAEVKRQVLDAARAAGCESEVRQWMSW